MITRTPDGRGRVGYVAHFAPDAARGDRAADPDTTLCGLPVESVLMTDRPADCPACRAAHRAAGWTFPLPVTVITPEDEERP